MTLKACIISARDQGHISREESAVLEKKYDELVAARLPEAEIKARMVATTAAEAQERKRRALLTETVRQRLVQETADYTTWKGQTDRAEAVSMVLEHNGQAKFKDVEHARLAIMGTAQHELEQHLYEYRKGALTGDKRRTMGETAASLDNVVREAFGEGTGDAKAKGFAQAWGKVAEDLRVRFNAAGGQIGKLDKWGLPQVHDAEALTKAGREAWVQFITPRLNAEAMRHPLTGLKMTAAELRQSLEHVHETIVTDGFNTADPTGAQGRGALFKQHSDHRFLHFKDANAWLEYQKQFGASDVYATMINHLHTMSRDIALAETLGPNPDLMFTYLKNLALKEAASAGTLDAAQGKLRTADAMLEMIKGSTSVPVNGMWASAIAGARNIISASSLGSAPITAIGDTGTQAMARAYAGLPVMGSVSDVVKNFGPQHMREAAAAGLIADNLLQTIHQDARQAAGMSGPELTRYIADRSHAVSGLTALTRASKNAFGMALFHELGSRAGMTFAELPGALRRTLERHGFDAGAWDQIRKAELHTPEAGGPGFLRAKEISEAAGRDLAERYLMMAYRETKFAVTESTIRSSVTMIGENQPGTIAGELVRSVGQFKSFGVALVMLQAGRVAREVMSGAEGRVRGAAYAAGLMVATTALGALALQLKEITQGRDPRKMTLDDKLGRSFWGAALLQGGGMGIYGDFLFASVNRQGNGLAATTMGPIFDRLDNIRNLTVGNLMQLHDEKDSNFGRELTRFIKSNTPGSTLWYARLAFDRVIWDRLQSVLDPKAHQAFRRQVQSRKRDFGNDFWSAPGSGGVQRGPDLGRAFGAR